MSKIKIDEIIEKVEIQPLCLMVQHINEIVNTPLTLEEKKVRNKYMNELATLLDSKSDIDAIKKMLSNFFGIMHEKIDLNKMVLLTLCFLIEARYAYRDAYKDKLNISEINAEMKFPEVVEWLRGYLDGKDIRLICQDGNKRRLISSTELCAEDVFDNKGNIIGKEATRLKRIKAKEEAKKTVVKREKINKEIIKRWSNGFLDEIIENIKITDLCCCTYEGIGIYISDEMIFKLLGINSLDNFDSLFSKENWEKMHNNPERVKILEEAINGCIQYINLEKVLLSAAFRVEQSIDKVRDEESTEKRNEILQRKKILLEKILKELNNTKRANCILEKNPSWPNMDGTITDPVIYKKENIENAITRFLPSGIYASDELIDETRERIFNGEKKLNDIDKDLLKFMRLSKKEIVEYSIICEENFLFVLDNYQISTETIKEILSNSFNISNKVIDKLLKENKITKEDLIELFVMSKISIECIHGYITNEEITELYENKKISTEQLITFFHYGDIDTETMGALIVLYGIEREIIEALDNKTIEISEIKPLSEAEAMYALDEEYIFSRYTDKNEENNFKTLEPLYWGFQNGKLSVEELDELYREGIVKEEDLYEASLKGYFSKEKIEELYLRSLISDEILDDLSENNIITKNFAKSVKSKLKIDKIQGSFPFTGKIETIDINGAILIPPDSKIERQEGSGKTSNSKKGKGIDPQFKIDVLANLPVGIKKIPEECLAYEQDNPFYNYEFFVIPEKNGELTEDSIVIAEKLYTSRSKRTTWAYGDATYIFKLKDFKRISKKSKKEIQEFMKATEVKDVENYNAYDGTERVVHRSMFYWSTELGKRISKMLGKSKTSSYTEEELEEIKNSPLEINEFYQEL